MDLYVNFYHYSYMWSLNENVFLNMKSIFRRNITARREDCNLSTFILKACQQFEQKDLSRWYGLMMRNVSNSAASFPFRHKLIKFLLFLDYYLIKFIKGYFLC